MSHTYAKARRHPWLLLAAVLTLGLLSFMLVTQSQAAPSNTVNITNLRVRWNGTGTYDWANGYSGDPAVTTGAHACTPATVVTGSVINCPGTNGLFDGGTFNGSTTPPTPPTFLATSDSTLAAHTFGVDPLSGDVTQCSPTQTLTGDPTVYTGAGSEKNGDLLSSDTWGNGSVPPKDDLANVYAVAHKAGSTNEIFFAAERNFTSGQGDSHIDFEFLQSALALVPSGPGPNGVCSGSFSGDRKQGDILLSADFTKGGTLGDTILYVWQCATQPTAVGTTCNPSANGAGNGNGYVQTSDATLTAAVKFGVNCTIPSGTTVCNGPDPVDCGGWACRHADGTYESTIDTNKFMEGGIDLNALGFTGCVNSFLPHTRSSQQFTATLKDFTLLKFNTCSASVVTHILRNDTSADVTNGTVPSGTIVHDTATVTGSGDGVPTGTVTFQLYATSDCTGTHTDEAITPLTAGGATTATAASSNKTVSAALSYKATYTPDANSVYPAVPASAVACESLSPTSASVVTNIIRNDLSTDVTNGTVPSGTIVHDTATVTGSGDGTSKPTGTVTFQLFATDDCTGAHTDEAITPLTAGTGTTATAASSNTTVTAALSYKATYSGDGVYPAVAASAVSCESLSPTSASVVTNIIRNDLGTDVTNSTVPNGTVVHDTATVTGSGDGTSKPTGTVTFQLFATGDCTGSHTDEAITPLTAGTGTTATAASSNTTVTAALSYKATYSGDTVYPAVAASAVSCESLSPTASGLVTHIIRNDLSTDVTNATVPTGTIVHDTAIVTGSGDGTSKPTGTITFELFATSDCSGSHTDEAITPLTAGTGTTATAASSNTTVTAALSYKATYSGDTVYPAIADTAVDCESLSPTTASVVTHIIRNSDSTDITNTIVIVGTTVHDTATVTGSGDGSVAPTGTITFELFASKDCTGSHTDEVVSVTAGAGATATAASSDATANADLSYKAVYSGDDNYPAVADTAVSCESLQIVNPATRISISDQIINLPSDATGTVTYGVFTDDQCQNAVTTGVPSDGNITPAVNTVGAGGIAPSSLSYTPTGSGTFYIKAVFTGSGVYAGVVFTSCTEHVVITE